MPWFTPLGADRAGAVQASHATARSAERLLRLHALYVTVAPEYEASLCRLYLDEVKILIRRCLKLGWYLLAQRHSGAHRSWNTSSRLSNRSSGPSPTA